MKNARSTNGERLLFAGRGRTGRRFEPAPSDVTQLSEDLAVGFKIARSPTAGTFLSHSLV
jgi:hypothetical protein